MSAPLPHLPLVGRSRELEQLRGVLELTAARREPASILLHGESGVGKTRLLQSLTEWANRSGWSTSIGTAYPVEVGVPYAALTDGITPDSVVQRVLGLVPAPQLDLAGVGAGTGHEATA